MRLPTKLTVHLDRLALGDLENQVDPVVAAADDARRDSGRDAALLGIGGGDIGGVPLGLGGVEHLPRGRFDDLGQILVLDAAVALEVDHVDRGEFRHRHHQRSAPWRQFDRFEQPLPTTR